MTDTPAYRMVLDYLINNAAIDNPARPSEIVDGTGLSRTRVYALLAKRANSVAPDETISDGIFIAPETFRINGGRPSKTYYADLKRAKDKQTISELGINKVPLPVTFTQFLVQPIALTPSVLQGFQKERETINTILDTPSKPMVESMHGATHNMADRFDKFPEWYKILGELFDKAHENYTLVHKGEATLDKELFEEYREHLTGIYGALIQQATVLRMIMQHPYFDTATHKLFAEDAKKPNIAPPVVKEI